MNGRNKNIYLLNTENLNVFCVFLFVFVIVTTGEGTNYNRSARQETGVFSRGFFLPRKS